MCRWTGHTFQKYTQPHSVYHEEAKDTGYKPLQLCDSLQNVYNSELKRLYHKSWATWKYKQMPSNAAMCDIWWPVPSTISHKTEKHIACQCHFVLFLCKKNMWHGHIVLAKCSDGISCYTHPHIQYSCMTSMCIWRCLHEELITIPYCNENWYMRILFLVHLTAVISELLYIRECTASTISRKEQLS